ncbi:MAG TPA: F0F1 ATP synthase subunit beta, partial [Chloroflexia bacterium]|nr:F0F1 ATP synthase subunit beta [Chloroflexia bacterium]
MVATSTRGATGRIVQITGPVVDIEFPPDQLPEIYNAVEIPITSETAREGVGDGGSGSAASGRVICEVQQHLGNDWVRSVSMTTTDGLRRGMPAYDTGSSISVPVGEATLGRIFNVTGDTIDERGPVDTQERYSIHRPAPRFEDQSTVAQIFETGLKVIDLIAPFSKGGKIGV